MPTREQIARRLAETLKTADQRGQRLVFSGRRTDIATVTMDGAPLNQMYVRYPDSSREETTVWGRIYGVGAPIWVGPAIDGGEEYKGPAWELGTLMYGAAYLTMVQPVVITELLPTTVGENNFKPGRLGPSQEGGSYVHVEAFEHSGGRWTGSPDLDITAHFPTDPFVIKRVGIYHDPSDNTLHAFAGEEVYGYGEFTDADRALVPDGTYPIGAVYLTAATSISSATRFDDWRLHLALLEASGSGGSSFSLGGGGAETVKFAPTGEKIIQQVVVQPGVTLIPLEGVLTAASIGLRVYNVWGVTRTLTRIFAAINTAPDGDDIILDILKNGTTIFADPGDQPIILDGANTGETTAIDETTWGVNDYLQLDIDQVGTVVPGSDLTVHICFT